MIFRLALELKKTVREIETEMSSSEFFEWIAYFEWLESQKGVKE